MSPEGGGKKRFYLVGTDYVYPRTTNKILRIYLTKAKGVQESGIMEVHSFHTRRSDHRGEDQELLRWGRWGRHQYHQR